MKGNFTASLLSLRISSYEISFDPYKSHIPYFLFSLIFINGSTIFTYGTSLLLRGISILLRSF